MSSFASLLEDYAEDIRKLEGHLITQPPKFNILLNTHRNATDLELLSNHWGPGIELSITALTLSVRP